MRARIGIAAVLAAAGVWWAGAGPAQAHVTNVSRSNVTVDGAAIHYRLELRPLDLAVAIGLIADISQPLSLDQVNAGTDRIASYVLQRVMLFGDGRECPAGAAQVDTAGFPEGIAVSWRAACPAPFEKLLIQYLVFSDVDTHHATVGRLVAGARATDFTMNLSHPELEIALNAVGESPWEQARRFFALGVEHILIGYDHLLFLFSLIVASLRWRYLLSVITMFTLAHTITLLLAAFGYVNLPSRFVESAIALSIAYVATENLFQIGLRRRWAVTFGFGLVHGLGFASVLSELTQGQEIHLGSLFTFNLGVEAGQMLVVLGVLPVLIVMSRLRLHRRVELVTSMGILAMALYWFGERAIWG